MFVVSSVGRANLGLEEEIVVFGVDGVPEVFETVDLLDLVVIDLESVFLVVAAAE